MPDADPVEVAFAFARNARTAKTQQDRLAVFEHVLNLLGEGDEPAGH